MSTAVWRPFYVKSKSGPLPKVVGASGAWLELEGGHRVLDMTCSWWVTLHGHCQPEIAAAIGKQAHAFEQVLFANFTHDPGEELCDRLIAIAPDHLDKVFFSDNGSTTVEVALKMAVQSDWNPGHRFIAFEGAYHGDTAGAMSVSDGGVFTDPFRPMLFDVDRVPYPTSPEQESATLNAIAETANDSHCAVIIEPLVQGAGGMRMCRPEFLRALDHLTKELRLLTIYDEVFTGFGRTGELFACIKSGTQPDIVCLSKGITGGFLPLSVTLTTQALFETFDTFFHGHSYTANPIACAAANASLELLKAEPFRKFEAWHHKYGAQLSGVNHFRVCGTIAAFELPGEGEYLSEIGVPLEKRCLEQGVFIRPLGRTVYLLPPYCTTEAELEHAYQIVAEALLELGLFTS
jgi:adenosylmethionine-8-amino-7-oxononanoate aminotransferase